MIFHDFPRFLEESGVYLIQPPKLCARPISTASCRAHHPLHVGEAEHLVREVPVLVREAAHPAARCLEARLESAMPVLSQQMLCPAGSILLWKLAALVLLPTQHLAFANHVH